MAYTTGLHSKDQHNERDSAYCSLESTQFHNESASDLDKSIFRHGYEPKTVIIPEVNTTSAAVNQNPSNNKTNVPSYNVTAMPHDVSNRVGWGGRVKYAEIENSMDQQFIDKILPETTIHRDVNKMLNVSISTIMLLANGKWDIPVEYFMWTELFLRSVKDEHGDNPRNIKELLNYIKYMRTNLNINWENASYLKSATAARKPSRIPVAKNTNLTIDTSKINKKAAFEPNAASTPVNQKNRSTFSPNKRQSEPHLTVGYVKIPNRPIFSKIIEQILFPWPSYTVVLDRKEHIDLNAQID